VGGKKRGCQGEEQKRGLKKGRKRKKVTWLRLAKPEEVGGGNPGDSFLSFVPKRNEHNREITGREEKKKASLISSREGKEKRQRMYNQQPKKKVPKPALFHCWGEKERKKKKKGERQGEKKGQTTR